MLTEIGDGYILVDDSMLCENEGDGIAFMVPTSDVRVRRCVEFGGLKEGDIVVVYFTGEIDAASGYLVNGAYSLAKGMVQDGYVSVPE